MKDRKMQIVINVITVMNVVLIGLFIYHLVQNNKYNAKYIYHMAEKVKQYDNYMIEIEEQYDVTEQKVTKRRIMQTSSARREDEEDRIEWYYGNKKIYTNNSLNDKKYVETEYEDFNHIIRDEFDYWQYTNVENCRYIRKEQYKHIECVIFEFPNIERIGVYRKDGTGYDYTDYSHKIWIDIKTGTIVKKEVYKEGKLDKVTEYKTQINCVTDKDIALPIR